MKSEGKQYKYKGDKMNFGSINDGVYTSYSTRQFLEVSYKYLGLMDKEQVREKQGRGSCSSKEREK